MTFGGARRVFAGLISIGGLLIGGLLIGGCAHHEVRFRDAPIAWYVDDDQDIPPPKPRNFSHLQYFADILAVGRLLWVMDVPDLEPAHNTNALDELPNSTWFTNRIGVRTVTPQEAARGSVVDSPPVLPLRVVDGKTGGRNPGFVAEDATGRKFLIKFDRMENPDMQTGTGVLVNRVFWTLGYNVPQDTLVYFERDDLQLDPEAEFSPRVGKPRPMTIEDLEAVLESSPRQGDGSYRALASLYLEGVPLGGPPAVGVRKDDPNDVVPHQHRRELRGLRVFAAWVSHTDMKEDNFLDMYVEDAGRHYVRHYMVDFGEALGAHQAEFDRLEDGFEFYIDWQENTLALLTLGLRVRDWEEQRQTPWPSIGAFSADLFEPEDWKEAYPFAPFFEMTPADAYWAAKIVMRFDRPLLEAIVAQAEFSPAASAYLVDTLLERARKIGHAYIESMSPLDAFRFADGHLCAHDLGIAYGLARGGVVERIEGEDEDAVVLEQAQVGPSGEVCLPAPNDDLYRVWHLRTRRGDERRPPLQLHFKGGRKAQVLGIIRSGPCVKGRGRPRCL